MCKSQGGLTANVKLHFFISSVTFYHGAAARFVLRFIWTRPWFIDVLLSSFPQGYLIKLIWPNSGSIPDFLLKLTSNGVFLELFVYVIPH